MRGVIKRAFLLSIFSLCALSAVMSRPKLVVQIIVSQMRYDYLERFKDNFSQTGFKSFYEDGMVCSEARYNYMLTTTPAGIMTIATGADPVIHGVTGEWWINPTTGDKEYMVIDESVSGVGCDYGLGQYSPKRLEISTLSDKLRQSDTLSRIVSIAIDPLSAVLSGGNSAETYWIDRGRGNWMSSSAYFNELKPWVVNYNSNGYSSIYADMDWSLCLPQSHYKNTRSTIINNPEDKSSVFSFGIFKRIFGNTYSENEKQTRESKPKSKWVDFSKKLYTPAGNKIVFDFANQVINFENFGQDEHTDLLTICFDSQRYIGEMFGPESVELEDAYYQFDRDLGNFLQTLFSRFRNEDVLVMLTSDHGTSNGIHDRSSGKQLFDVSSFVMIMNAFLSAQYETGNWILGYNNRQIYLNRTLIYKYGFNLEEIQKKVASFALQYRGVSHAIASTSLQNGYFGSGYAEKIYNSYYPFRGGDVTINLMPGWIEDQNGICSNSGSHYEYDTHVPLMFRGSDVGRRGVLRQRVDMTSVAPTISYLMGIGTPDACTGTVIDEIIETETNY